MFGISSRFNASPPQTQLLATRTRRTSAGAALIRQVSQESAAIRRKFTIALASTPLDCGGF